MAKSVISHPVVLGNGEVGEQRQSALMQWAQELKLFWNGKPSLSRLLQHIADQRIATQEQQGSEQVKE